MNRKFASLGRLAIQSDASERTREPASLDVPNLPLVTPDLIRGEAHACEKRYWPKGKSAASGGAQFVSGALQSH